MTSNSPSVRQLSPRSQNGGSLDGPLLTAERRVSPLLNEDRRACAQARCWNVWANGRCGSLAGEGSRRIVRYTVARLTLNNSASSALV
jgi:hypothetical protein